MLLTTTASIEGRTIADYQGLVHGEAIVGAHLFKDLFAGIRDVVGGRAGSYESTLREARNHALEAMIDQARQRGAQAIIGIDFDYEIIGERGSMLMVAAVGTAVTLR